MERTNNIFFIAAPPGYSNHDLGESTNFPAGCQFFALAKLNV